MKHAAIPIAQVEIPDIRVTSYFDQDVYAEFKQTVARAGVIEPIVVVEVGETYFLVDGLHRLQEAEANGSAEIQAVVIPGDEKDVFLTNLFLNVMRGKPKVSEMRQVIKTLITGYKMSKSAIQKKTGLSVEYINDLEAIGKLPEEILLGFDTGTLSKGAALALTRLSGAELQLRVYAQVAGRAVTVDDIEGIVALLREEKGEREPPPQRENSAVTQQAECDQCHEPSVPGLLTHIKMCPDCQQAWAEFWLQRIKNKEKVA